MMDIISWVKSNWSDVAAIYGSIVAICSVIVKFTKTDTDNKVLNVIVKCMDFFSTTFNKTDAEKLEK